MAACSYCGERKGKRTCPALGAMICPQCCGQHRLAQIACPSDCVYLGGLSIVRDPTSGGFTKDDYNAVFERLRAYGNSASDVRTRAVMRFFEPGVEPAEWEMGVGLGYLLYGFRDATQQRLIDRFLAARGRSLPPGQVAAVVALQHAQASLYEVTSLQPGVGIELRDLLSGETVRVRDVTASRGHKKWDLIFTWIVAFPDHLELTGAGCGIPRQNLERVRASIDDAIAHARREHPKLSDRELVGVVAWAPVAALREAIRNFRMPTLQTTTRESMQFCKAHYHVVGEIHERLKGAPDLERDGHTYTWINRETMVVLGTIIVDDDELVLETASRERNERGKQLLEALLGDAIVHELDSIQDPESAMRDAKPPESVPPDGEMLEVMRNYLKEHYRRWPDDALPALGGKTPRKAVKSKAGRAKVVALLKDIENGTLGMPGGDAVDFDALRRELGLEDYDANRAPDPTWWLAMDETLRQRAIEEHHRSLTKHPETPNALLHALAHMIVENQLAANNPPDVRVTLQRLLDGGLSRHEALHAIASVVFEAIADVMKAGKPADQAKISRSLTRLRPEDWRFERV